MLAARLCSMGVSGRAALSLRAKPLQISTPLVRLMAQDTRSGFARRKTLKVAGAAVVGMGALAYYGLGLSNEAGEVDPQVMWEPYVKERIRDTYIYFCGSIAATAASVAAIFRSPAAINVMIRQWTRHYGLMDIAIATLGSGVVAESIPYQPAPGAKQLAWLAHCAVVGAVVAPVCLAGFANMTRAAWYTAGMVAGLSTVAACAPSDKFKSCGPFDMGHLVVSCAMIGITFLPLPDALAVSLLYCGFVVMLGMFVLYHTQKIIHKAESHPVGDGAPPFDPVKASMGIYWDTMWILVSILTWRSVK